MSCVMKGRNEKNLCSGRTVVERSGCAALPHSGSRCTRTSARLVPFFYGGKDVAQTAGPVASFRRRRLQEPNHKINGNKKYCQGAF